MNLNREIELLIANDNHILYGPRQVGKSTLVNKFVPKSQIISMEDQSHKMSWIQDDYFPIRFLESAIGRSIDSLTKKEKKSLTIGIDEIHKLYDWRRKLKLLIDNYKDSIRFLVTGSSAFDLISNDGDSLQGRLFYTKLLPLTTNEVLGILLKKSKSSNTQKRKDHLNIFSELLSQMTKKTNKEKNLNLLIDNFYDCLLQSKKSVLKPNWNLTSFPEPYKKKEISWGKRWAQNYLNNAIDKDLKDVSKVPDTFAVFNLFRLIQESSGSTVSINGFAKTILKSHESVSNMLMALEKIWIIWKLESYHKQMSKIIRKDCKYYVVDWIFNQNLEVKTANLLMRRITYLKQQSGDNYGLYFYRDYEQREVDFIITKDEEVVLAIECKEKEQHIPTALKYVCNYFNCPGIVITNQKNDLIKIDSK
ncbi:MAG: ATP-binding protein [Oligoflexia bacterium]|nr:ATP-binding protein [Oligoflexia bacterium]